MYALEEYLGKNTDQFLYTMYKCRQFHRTWRVVFNVPLSGRPALFLFSIGKSDIIKYNPHKSSKKFICCRRKNISWETACLDKKLAVVGEISMILMK